MNYIENTSQRLYAHLFFWIAYYIYRVFLYSSVAVMNTFENVAIVQFLELPVKILVVYVNFYVLMPTFFIKRLHFWYGVSLLITIIVGTILQTEMIRLCINLGVYGFDTSELYAPYKFRSIASHIVFIVVITGIIKILKDSYLNQQVNQQLIQEKLETELKFLKTQINPHFLFNTLNNLYALILSKSPLAETVVLKLSQLMNYMLYESNQPQIALSKEIDYLKDYIDLEKLRFGEELSIQFDINGNVNGQMIEPILLLPFVENAFKHAKNDTSSAIWINIRLELRNNELNFEVKNSCVKSAESPQKSSKSGGIGLLNVRRRLELLYPNQHTLSCESNNHIFKTLLHLQLTSANEIKMPHS